MKTRKKPCIRSGLFWSCLADVTIPRFFFNFLVSSYFDFLPPVQNCFLGRVEGEGAGSVPLYSSVEDSRHFLARIRIRKSVPLTYGSVPLTYGSGSYCFRQAANKNRVFFFEVFLLITFWKYIYISLQRKKKAKRSYESRNQGFLLFCFLMEGSGSVQNNDGSGSRTKTHRSRSGSTILWEPSTILPCSGLTPGTWPGQRAGPSSPPRY